MPIEHKRMKYTMDEIFGVVPPSQQEVETPRTPNIGDIREPNWDGPMDQFHLGLQNAHESVLSNMIADKTKNSFGISDFLNYVEISHTKLFEFILSVLEKITRALANLTKENKDVD